MGAFLGALPVMLKLVLAFMSMPPSHKQFLSVALHILVAYTMVPFMLGQFSHGWPPTSNSSTVGILV
jgi:hypothetical protein